MVIDIALRRGDQADPIALLELLRVHKLYVTN